ncbi:hypothetical protein CAPTEDRAFT_222193 [Capitella teleta]|uniref:SCP domain-containing protein n=1 Tax=Capitella teleta TaxID=283909 RepID=R7TNL0_CAPTE|nr:hypothetical protein CAPTEDRAFT_222193 [Capitella teleta]|eukprot:ELT93131.1 hypothetical protein CAPTEDRAFT_222193 [Capitella teleta]
MEALRILLCCGLLVSLALGVSLKKPAKAAQPPPQSPKYEKPLQPPRYGQHQRQKRSASCLVSSTLTEAEKQQVIDRHNYLRDLEDAGNMAEMVYDEGLASVAQEWANQCIWAHGMMEDCDGQYAGQNLHLYGNTSVGPPLDVVYSLQGWYDEKAFYHFEDTSCDENEIQLFQLVWDNSFKVGCGYAICDEVETNQGTFYNAGYFACNYYAGGNFIDTVPYWGGDRCNDCESLFIGYANGWKCNENQRCEACDPDYDNDCTEIECTDEDASCPFYDPLYCEMDSVYFSYMNLYCRYTCSLC